MKAMLLNNIYDLASNNRPLQSADIAIPQPKQGEVLIKINCCGVCHTELDEIEGRTPPPTFPIIPGHQVVGIIEEVGPDVSALRIGQRVGVAWIYAACGHCEYCKSGNENLCDQFLATGRDMNGGYAEYMVANASHTYPIPAAISDAEAAPLLCAGAIGYRSIRLSGLKNGQLLGLTGFGASAHLVLRMVKFQFPDTPVFVFARNPKERDFAIELGALWAGDTTDRSPEKLHAIIDTTPVWKPVLEALANLEKGGRLIINAIRKEDVDKHELLRISYPEHLWMEKEIKSVANVSSRDVSEFLELAAKISLKPEFQKFSLDEANTAIMELKEQKIRGAKVLMIH